MGCCAVSHGDLIAACQSGSVDKIAYMLDCGRDADDNDVRKLVSTCWCCVGAELPVCHCFIHWWKNNGNSFNYRCTPLCAALSRDRDLEVITFLVSRGARVDVLGTGNRHDFCMQYPIIVACGRLKTKVETIIFLLKQDGAHATIEQYPDRKSIFTPFHESAFRNALYSKNIPIIYFLLEEFKIDLNDEFLVDGKCSSRWGKSYLMCAVEAGLDFEHISMLLAKGANAFYKSPETEDTVFHHVSSASCIIVQLLLDVVSKSVDAIAVRLLLNDPNIKGQTPFISLAQRANVNMKECVKIGRLMTQYGADIDAMDAVRLFAIAC
jgi:hypothetical protein